MPLYQYRAKEGPHKIIQGYIEAPDQEKAFKRIEEMGYFPVKIEEAEQDQEKIPAKLKNKKVKSQDIIIFSRQLATLIKSGIPILRALGILSEQTQSKAFSMIIKDIYVNLKEGVSFSQCLSQYPKIFSPFYTSMVQAGEDSGKLEEVLFRLSDYRKKREELISRVRLAMVYPLIMGCVGLGTIIFMFTFVMPRLMNIFNDLGENIPVPTKILIKVSGFVSGWWWAIAAGIAAIIIFIRMFLQKQEGKVFFSALILKIPILGDLMLKKEIALLSRTLELLIKSGISVLRSIELTAPVIGNEIIRENFIKGYDELKQGASLGRTLRHFKVFPAFMTNLIVIGEESGKLEAPLSELASSYEQDTEESVKTFTTILEPLMIVSMGLVIGFIVVAMLLPIFELNLMVG
ncbi:MAG: type II secretion system F family protein [Candidatus Omnitrophica bacterium]|nr:type II secretion system F family protein [Candidatus Omnitrophota bacterium]